MGNASKLRPRHILALIACSLSLAVSVVFGGHAAAKDAVAEQPVTIVFLDSEWSHDLSQHMLRSDQILQEFTYQTGIKVERSPAPEGALGQLDMLRKSLKTGMSSPDVYEVDVVWPAFLEDDSIDLKPYFVDELRLIDPDLVASYMIGGKLIGIPYRPNAGALYYRKDLLREYGYKAPPATWEQLEQMAARIQRGERAKGRGDFWGFVWPGEAGEGLICNGLEWQASDGGGHIIEADDTISVNNPKAIRSWERAAHWVGTISPASVIYYGEWDAAQAFLSKRAAFFRGWARNHLLGTESQTEIPDWIGSTRVPAGSVAQVSTLGGWGLGVSRTSPHRKEAFEFVRFLLDKEIDLEKNRPFSLRPDIYPEPGLSKPESGGRRHLDTVRFISRPSSATGAKYEDVDRAYIQAVHSVLTGKNRAEAAAAALQSELEKITGFKAGPPR